MHAGEFLRAPLEVGAGGLEVAGEVVRGLGDLPLEVLGLASLLLPALLLPGEPLGLSLPPPKQRLLLRVERPLPLPPQHLLDLTAGLLHLPTKLLGVGPRLGRALQRLRHLLPLLRRDGALPQRLGHLPHRLRGGARVALAQRLGEPTGGGVAGGHLVAEGAQRLGDASTGGGVLGGEGLLKGREAAEGLVAVEASVGEVVEQPVELLHAAAGAVGAGLRLDLAGGLSEGGEVVVGELGGVSGDDRGSRASGTGRGARGHRDAGDEEQQRGEHGHHAELSGELPGEGGADVYRAGVGGRVVDGGLHEGGALAGRPLAKLPRDAEAVVELVVGVEAPSGVERAHRAERVEERAEQREREGRERERDRVLDAHHMKPGEQHQGDGGGEGEHGERGGGVEGALPSDAAGRDGEDGEIRGGVGHRR